MFDERSVVFAGMGGRAFVAGLFLVDMDIENVVIGFVVNVNMETGIMAIAKGAGETALAGMPGFDIQIAGRAQKGRIGLVETTVRDREFHVSELILGYLCGLVKARRRLDCHCL